MTSERSNICKKGKYRSFPTSERACPVPLGRDRIFVPLKYATSPRSVEHLALFFHQMYDLSEVGLIKVYLQISGIKFLLTPLIYN